MRVLCVPVLLAVTAHPVGVGAHAELPSDIAVRSEVQRHMRVQERAHGEDVEERMNDFTDSEGELIPNMMRHVYNDALPESYITLGNNLAHIPGNVISNHYNDKVNEPMTETSQQANTKDLEANQKAITAPDTFLSAKEQEMLPKIDGNMNKRVRTTRKKQNASPKIDSNMNKQTEDDEPMQVFEAFNLHTAKEKLFEQPQLVYWVKYMEVHKKVIAEGEVHLLSELLMYYSMKELVEAVARVPNNEIALRVQDEIFRYWFTLKKNPLHPQRAFDLLHLNQIPIEHFDDSLFLFWMNYVKYYCAQDISKANKFMRSILKKHFPSFLRTKLNTAQESAVILRLEQRLKDEQLNKWQTAKTSADEVRQFAEMLKTKAVKNSMLKNALKKAVSEYLKSHE